MMPAGIGDANVRIHGIHADAAEQGASVGADPETVPPNIPAQEQGVVAVIERDQAGISALSPGFDSEILHLEICGTADGNTAIIAVEAESKPDFAGDVSDVA